MVPKFVDAKMLGTTGWGDGKLKVQRLSPEKKSKTAESARKVRISGGVLRISGHPRGGVVRFIPISWPSGPVWSN